MRNFPLIVLLSFTCQSIFSQPKLPILEADSNLVSVKVDGTLVAIWNIHTDRLPGEGPDVFVLENSSGRRKVTYYSNRDSLTFIVNPGVKYDFTFVLKNVGAFPMRLTSFEDPVFQQRGVLISLITVFILLGWLFYANKKLIPTTFLLRMGILSPLLFWLATITGGFIHGDYNHLHNVVSELGAIGTRSEIFMSSTEILIAILSIFSVIGFCRACKQNRISFIPVLTILSLSVTMIWAAFFPMHHEWHGLLGPIPLILNVGVLLSLILWRGKNFRSIRFMSLVSLILMSLIFLRFIPDFRGNWEGLIQRFFYLGWSVWSISLGLNFIRKPI